MTDPIHARLLQLGEDLRRHRKLTADLTGIEAAMRRHELRLETLGAEIAKESRDVRKLEGLSLTALFHTLLGDRDEKLGKERQEFLAVKLRYDAEMEAGRPLQEQADRCRRELEDLGDLAARRTELLDERERQLRQSGTAAGRELIDLVDRLADVRADRRENDEAIAAGRDALDALQETADQLGRARNWGQLDMLGGGLITTAIKHSRIDDARSAAERAQRHLQRFARELADLGERRSELTVEIGGFEKFADYFFDGLIFDWMVQSKIRRAQAQVQETTDRAREIVLQLERLADEQQQLQQRLEADRERLLTGSE
ncbi:MAG: hypothetical protein KDC98_06055 [Planctomycetes bacterium]|nr:hypothetical protein [Planctomycetota bacterium]